ncbi:MAG TPA: discoidin domain-containing protein [Polyangiales bacterium]|nr:discoidin domain-containing protein [Polyangiales bacterium]
MNTADSPIAEQKPHVPAGQKAPLEWLWRGETLRTAQARPKLSALGRERLRRARLAAELADRALDPVEPLRAGSPVALAISLYREAAYWALIQPNDAEKAPNLNEAFDRSTQDLSQAAGGADKLASVRATLIDKTFIETADDPADIARREADLAQAFVYRLIEHDVDRDDRVADILIQRWLRVGAAAVVILGLLFSAVVGIQHATRGPDLAAGKPWRASSQAFQCHPENTECGGARSAMFFHTTEEDKPWVEIDLGSPQEFARVTVTNREDCCLERAVPLVVEVGDDQKTWKQVARVQDVFREWDVTFPPVKARYVRLRVDRRSILHLVKVSVWSK